MLTRNDLKVAADAFAVLTGLSFVLSGLLQEIAFSIWGLDFTAIASIEDVVMGGLRFLYALLVAGIAFVLIGILAELLDSIVEPQNPLAAKLRTLLVLSVSSVYFIALTYWGFTAIPDLWLIITVTSLSGIALFLILILFAVLTSTLGFREFAAHVRKARPVTRSVIVAPTIVASIFSFGAYITPYDRLKIAADNTVLGQCGRLPPQSAKILWLGSQAVVLRCGPQTVVIKTGEEPYSLLVEY